MRSIEERIEKLRTAFHNSVDFKTEEFRIEDFRGVMVWLSTMTENADVTAKINLAYQGIQTEPKWSRKEVVSLEGLCKHYFLGTGYEVLTDWEELPQGLSHGKVLFLVEGLEGAISFEAKDTNYRSIAEPTTQTIIRGPKDSFVESAHVNISLLRRRIFHPDLAFEKFVLGADTRTPVYVAYMDNIVDPALVKEVRSRLNKAKPYAIFDTGNLDDYIADKTYTPFPMSYGSERPDSIAAHLVMGKVAILVEGSPFVTVAPTVFSDFFQSAEDYYQPYPISSFVRVIRYVAFMIALLFPAIYISACTYHFELIPTELLLNIGAQREDLPFPLFFEAMVMEITFEILREAGIRMPRAVGNTVSIVGGLVIGQAAVAAGVVSNTMVIIVALTAISSFVSPIYNLSVSTRLLRFMLLVLGALAGFFGVMLGMICIIAHMSSLRSFGVPYTIPFAPIYTEEHKDVLLRFPLWTLKRRPAYYQSRKPIKQPQAHNPSPPEGSSGKGDNY